MTCDICGARWIQLLEVRGDGSLVRSDVLTPACTCIVEARLAEIEEVDQWSSR